MKAAKKKRFRPGFGYLACQLAPAPSESERLVLVDRLDGGRTSAIVNSQEVRPSDPLRGPMPGEVIVTVVGKIERGFLVDLPEDTINSGSKVPVPQQSVKFS